MSDGNHILAGKRERFYRSSPLGAEALIRRSYVHLLWRLLFGALCYVAAAKLGWELFDDGRAHYLGFSLGLLPSFLLWSAATHPVDQLRMWHGMLASFFGFAAGGAGAFGILMKSRAEQTVTLAERHLPGYGSGPSSHDLLLIMAAAAVTSVLAGLANARYFERDTRALVRAELEAARRRAARG